MKSYLLRNIYLCTPVFLCGGGVYEGSFVMDVLRTSNHARRISNITIGQRRNVCYCQLELGGWWGDGLRDSHWL